MSLVYVKRIRNVAYEWGIFMEASKVCLVPFACRFSLFLDIIAFISFQVGLNPAKSGVLRSYLNKGKHLISILPKLVYASLTANEITTNHKLNL